MPNIVSARVPLTDPPTGIIESVWYRFLFDLQQLVSDLTTTVAALQEAVDAQPLTDYGSSTTNGFGFVTVSFAKVFTVAPAVVVTPLTGSSFILVIDSLTLTTFEVGSMFSTSGAVAPNVRFSWIAVGV